MEEPVCVVYSGVVVSHWLACYLNGEAAGTGLCVLVPGLPTGEGPGLMCGHTCSENVICASTLLSSSSPPPFFLT